MEIALTVGLAVVAVLLIARGTWGLRRLTAISSWPVVDGTVLVPDTGAERIEPPSPFLVTTERNPDQRLAAHDEHRLLRAAHDLGRALDRAVAAQAGQLHRQAPFGQRRGAKLPVQVAADVQLERPGAEGDLLAAWRERVGDRMWVVTRDEAISSGWFGPRVPDRVRPRIGDVVAAAHGRIGVFDHA